jgi:hypothetical protein
MHVEQCLGKNACGRMPVEECLWRNACGGILVGNGWILSGKGQCWKRDAWIARLRLVAACIGLLSACMMLEQLITLQECINSKKNNLKMCRYFYKY